MKRFGIIVAVIILLMIGGGLTTQLISSGKSTPIPVLQQSSNPEASVNAMLGWKAEQLFLAIGFIVTSLIGFAVVLALVFWFVDRGLRVSKAEARDKPAPPARTTANEGT